MGWVLFSGIFLLIIFIGVLFILAMNKQAYENNVIHHSFRIANLPDAFNNYKIFFISDIHRRLIEQALLDQLAEKPDIIIIGGDLAEEGVPFTRIEKNLQQLSGIAPLYFVWGNHDLFINEMIFRELLKKYRVKILENITVAA